MHTSCSLPLHGQASPRPAWCSGSRRQPLDVQCRNKLLRKHTRGAKAADKCVRPRGRACLHTVPATCAFKQTCRRQELSLHAAHPSIP